MSIHTKPAIVQKAALHLLDSAGYKTKSGDPLEVISKKFGDNFAIILSKLGATNEELEKLKSDSLGHFEQMRELQQMLVRGTGYAGPESPQSLGQKFTDDEGVKAFAASGARGRYGINVKTTVTTGSTSGGPLGTPHRDAPVMMQQRRLRVRDLLPVIQVTDGSVEYPSQTTRPGAAAMVAEGDLKPESALAFELKNAPARVIAHWIPASRQVLDDMPQLRGIIDTELLYGLALKEEQQLLNGDGTGQNLNGMVTQATAFAAPYSISSPTSIDMIALGIAQLAIANYEIDGIVVNTADWWRMKTTKDAGGNYIIGVANGETTANLWGIPVVPTTAMSIDKFLIGNFQQAATIYDRWQARVEISTEHSDFFIRNLVALLAEERLALAVKRAGALVYGDFGLVA